MLPPDSLFVFAGRVYQRGGGGGGVEDEATAAGPLLSLLSSLSPQQREAAGLGLTAACLVGGFFALVALQQQPRPRKPYQQPGRRHKLLYSSGAPVFRAACRSSSPPAIHPALQTNAKEEEEEQPDVDGQSFSAELAQLGMRLNELSSNSNGDGGGGMVVMIVSSEQFASACHQLAKSRHLLGVLGTMDFSALEEEETKHPLVWLSQDRGVAADDLLVRASCAIPPAASPASVDYEPGARRIACIKRALRRRTYDEDQLRVLFAGLRCKDSVQFDELIEPTAHHAMAMSHGVWQRFLLQQSAFSRCTLAATAKCDLTRFELCVVGQVSASLSWAVVRDQGQVLVGDRGYSRMEHRYDVILDEDRGDVYFNLATVLPRERRDLVALLNNNNNNIMASEKEEEIAQRKEAEDEAFRAWFAGRHWRVCSTLPATTTDVALHVVSTLADAKKSLAGGGADAADVAIVGEDGTIIALQY